jgi:hypothetical protein
VLSLSVISGGANRALDLVHTRKVRALGENLAEALLVALGVERDDAAALAKAAMATVG